MLRGTRTLAIVLTLLSIACGGGDSPTPSPPGGNVGESITGRERIGWDQVAENAGQLTSLRFAIYVDGTRSEIADVSCASTAGSAGFACSGRLPAMSTGSHVLEIAAFTSAGAVVESPRSAPLRVTVTGASAPADPQPLESGARLTTTDGISLVATRVAEGLVDPTDVVVAPDDRVFITDTSGRVSVIVDGTSRDIVRVDDSDGHGGLLGLTLAPDFSASGHVYVVAAVPGESGPVFQIIRYRLAGDRAFEKMIVLPDVPASATPAAAIRFGQDGKLYVALDSGGSDDRATSPSEWAGKILRLEPDGRTPSDQAAASPVFWSGVRSPRGLDWTSDRTMWAAEDGIDGVERLRAIVLSDESPVHPTGRTSYVMPVPFGGRSVAAYRHDAVPEFSQDLFLASADAGYLLRISLDPETRSRAVRTERLLEGRVQTIRAVAVSHDGSLYVSTADTLWRLTASERLPRRESR